jgi:hypothetical protein
MWGKKQSIFKKEKAGQESWSSILSNGQSNKMCVFSKHYQISVFCNCANGFEVLNWFLFVQVFSGSKFLLKNILGPFTYNLFSLHIFNNRSTDDCLGTEKFHCECEQTKNPQNLNIQAN